MADPETLARGLEVRRLVAGWLASLTGAERDRLLQEHLAQARGPLQNGRLLRSMTRLLLAGRTRT